MIQKFIDSVFPDKLEKMCRTEKGTLANGIIFVGLGILLSRLIGLAGSAASSQYFLAITIPSLGLELLGAVISFIEIIAFCFLLHILAVKAFKAKGSFSQMLYMASLPFLVLSLLSALISLPFFFYPSLLCAVGVAGLLIGLYRLYLLYIVLKIVHKMSGKDAAITLVLGIAIVIVLALIFSFALLLLALTALKDLAAAMPQA